MSAPDLAGREPAGPYGIVAVASSAGGIAALRCVLCGLPEGFRLPIVVVQHLHPRHATTIAEVVGRGIPLATKLAEHGEWAEPATIYFAPPDRHLVVGATGIMRLTSRELVHFVRPSADVLFESVASAYRAAALACVLTGTGSDGATGAHAIRSRGGTVIVEDPASAQFSGMPQAAVDAGAADYVVPLDKISEAVRGLVEAERL